MPFSRVPGEPPANPSNEPPLIFSAAPIAAAHATRASAPPVLIRLTPRSASSATVMLGAHHDVERLRGNRPHERRDIVPLLHARRVQTIGAGLRKCSELINRRAGGRRIDQENFGPSN